GRASACSPPRRPTSSTSRSLRRARPARISLTRMEFNLAQVHEAIAEAIPDRECIVFRDRRLTWRDVTERTRRLANVLAGAGLGARPEGRNGLQGHESHEDHLAIYCYNGNEYLESMLGAFKARVGPINVNYRYV